MFYSSTSLILCWYSFIYPGESVPTCVFSLFCRMIGFVCLTCPSVFVYSNHVAPSSSSYYYRPINLRALQVVSYKSWVAILRKSTYELRVLFCELQSNFTSFKFTLQAGNKIKSCKLFFTSCKFKETILRVASCVLESKI